MNSETIIEERLKYFYQLMNTDHRKAKRFYNKEIYPVIERALIDGDADFLSHVADVVQRQLNKN